MNDDTRREIELVLYRNVFLMMISLWETPGFREQLLELARAYNPYTIPGLESAFHDYEVMQKTQQEWERLRRLYGEKESK